MQLAHTPAQRLECGHCSVTSGNGGLGRFQLGAKSGGFGAAGLRLARQGVNSASQNV
ncbi:MAG: hypothetical protein R2762_23055 [Bryobacteraceae bacterium]